MSKEVESADRALAKVLEVASKEQPRGKYNSYTRSKELRQESIPLRKGLQLQQDTILTRGA